jgi:hypothetical protein
MSNLSFTSKKQSLPVFYLCIRYIVVRMYLAICYPTYCRVANPFQPSPCPNSYYFWLINAAISDRVPILPAKMQNLPVFYLCIRYIVVRMYLAICYPTYCRVANPFQPSPCLNSYYFWLINAAISDRVPILPAKMQKSQLWTFITFFWLGIFSPYFRKLLIYI